MELGSELDFASLEEKSRLREADENITVVAQRFKSSMLSVEFPDVSEEDDVMIDPQSWRPVIHHKNQEWSLWDAGSGGKKTLFNVCYALAIHEAARERGMPVPIETKVVPNTSPCEHR